MQIDIYLMPKLEKRQIQTLTQESIMKIGNFCEIYVLPGTFNYVRTLFSKKTLLFLLYFLCYCIIFVHNICLYIIYVILYPFTKFIIVHSFIYSAVLFLYTLQIKPNINKYKAVIYIFYLFHHVLRLIIIL